MIRSIRRAAVPLLVFSGLLGLAYPLAMTGVAAVVAPDAAGGRPVVDDQGRVIGAALVGQRFTGPGYIHGRPSATDYGALPGGASNLGPSSAVLADDVAARVRALRQDGGAAPAAGLPADLVTASGSGLDPDISLAAARMQVARVAAARGLEPAVVARLVEAHVTPPVLGVLGEARVNVLALNMALDAASPAKARSAP
ncbi:potassium-transporting ATPase KdpC subunit [Tistrella bauzanensis]|uniref:Potassium-transporting ATPase KdpC subunit n=1 Tax=Tistrella bauzanensis TaxID=657419 RepID=A0ABQ1ILU9_9PROT|nr:potassium-transporting ATPase subunit KdpC [Tistrella bauzanensis]GGB46211.1 potassium-transporting ATPase KdpC subunit [Tistrella bauzanensis]